MDSINEFRAGVSKRRQHGEMKRLIFTALNNAGETGMSVKELALALSIKPGNLHAWFFANAKKVPSLEKIGKAKYRLTNSALGNSV